jgi:hypothetical protein
MTDEFDKKVDKWLEETDPTPPAPGTWQKRENYVPPYLREMVKTLRNVRTAALKSKEMLEEELEKKEGGN